MVIRVVAVVGLLLGVGAPVRDAHAERLPVKTYTTTDGLAGDYVIGIYRDSRGFLWFATRDGLSRFDGLRFTSYGIADGLPRATVNQVLESRAGVYWIATNGGGVCRFNPRGRRPESRLAGELRRRGSATAPEALFVPYQIGAAPAANRVNVLHEDRAGRLWAGTDMGLFRAESADGDLVFRHVDLPLLPADTSYHGIEALAEDSEGNLWIGGGWGLTRILPDGRAVVYRLEPPSARQGVNALRLTNTRELWVGSGSGLLVIDTAATSDFAGLTDPIIRTLRRSRTLTESPSIAGATGGLERFRWYTTADGLPHDIVSDVYLAAEGRAWIGSPEGLSELDGRGIRAYTTANGLGSNGITAIVDDAAGNLWVGTVAGVTRIIRHGLVTYDEDDGLRIPRIHSLSEDAAGNVFAVHGDYRISRFDGARFISVRPDLPADARCFWTSPCGYLDRSGEWWILTAAGLYRLPKVSRHEDLALRPPRAIYARANGLPQDTVVKVFEDRQRDLWVGTGAGGLVRWQRASGIWREYSEADGLMLSPGGPDPVSAFAEDTAGALWIGFNDGELARVRDGRMQMFGSADGLPAGMITALHVDRNGRLWIASNQAGLFIVEDPAALHPSFLPPVGGDALASRNVRCLTEDLSGRIYVGTSRGIDRIDPATGRVRHFGAGDGLTSEFVNAAFRDRRGMLWFGTLSGLSRLDPAGDSAPVAPEVVRVLISAVRVRGSPQPVPEIGAPDVGSLILSPDQNQLEIEFFGVAFGTGEPLKYQYRLEGIDADWSRPSELRSVNYGRLPSGSHRFLVRAVSSGAGGTTPAVVDFTILPPIYARWWFMALAALATGAAILGIYRVRVAQLLRVERVRARIATDLHDDIGASLSQIAILAEVAKQRSPSASRDAADPLHRIADTSRTLVDSMSDIVWAVNPEADSLADLVHRMRRFAEDTLAPTDIELTLRAPDVQEHLRLGADVRREIYLILKESVTNIAKHAACRTVTIDFTHDRGRLRLRVEDDGRGFDPAAHTDGNGLQSMRRRVAALGGTLGIDSKPGHGTTIELEIDQRRLARGIDALLHQ